MSDVSVIGLGAMGSALAKALQNGGYTLTVWNRSAGKAEALVSAGAVLAGSSEEALRASPVTITCIASHDKTTELLEKNSDALDGKTVIELSTGGSEEAERLAELLTNNGANWLIGIINGYPTAVGSDELVLSVVGDPDLWEQYQSMIKTLGGSSVLVGENAGMLASLFAALFTIRQGFMFGMIYGGLVCEKAGIPLETLTKQIPVSLGVLPAYHQYFADTVPTRNFDNPPATMRTYAAALDDALSTFKSVGANSALPQLFSDLAHQGIDAGLSDKALTALVELLNEK